MPVLHPGTTCWRTARASRVAVLVDAAAYYTAFREAARNAQHTLTIVGWDVDSRTELVPEAEPADGYPPTLLAFLNALLDAKPQLEVRVLAWDFSMIYALERELLSPFKFGWNSHARLQFVLDDHHPAGGSHHQKLVVVDDRVAFCGGVDLTIRRWDTPEHDTGNARRCDPKGTSYPPMHDVHVALEGEAARALGELTRMRWAAATGEQLPAPGSQRQPRSRFWRRTRAEPAGAVAPDPWPAALRADFRDVEVGIVRNQYPVDPGEPHVREVLDFNLAAIASARRSILIENQYLTAAAVGDALAQRLAEEDGPEVVVILPKSECGWMEQSSMGLMRSRMLQQLAKADRHQHLHIYFPKVPGSDGASLNVHSKVMVIDDLVLKIGSSNLSNRSLSLDTECDIVIEAEPGQKDVRRAIRGIAHRLLAEHLALAPDEVEARLGQRGSIAALIEAERGRPRCLEPLIDANDAPVNLAMLDGVFADPEQPIDADAFMERLVPADVRQPTRRSLYGVVAVVFGILLLTCAWRFTPLSHWASAEAVGDVVSTLREDPLAPLYVWLIYVIGAGAFFPITVLIAGTALAFDPWRALLFSMAGALSSAALSYALGRALGHAPLRRFSGLRLRRLSRPIRKRGFRTIVAARLLPLGNFTAINLIAGALHVPFRAYMLGNVVGLLPGMIGLSLLTDRLLSAFRRPTVLNVAVLLVYLCAIAWGLWRLKRSLDKKTRGRTRPLWLAAD